MSRAWCAVHGAATHGCQDGRTSTPAASTAKLRVFLLDDHELVRPSVREMLESDGDIELAGEAASAAQAGARDPA